MSTLLIRVSPEEVDDNFRMIEIKPDQTFEDLHKGIVTAYDIRKKKKSASFFTSDSSWKKGKEISIEEKASNLPEGSEDGSKVSLSSRFKNSDMRFVYVNEGLSNYTFHVELEEITQNEGKGKYPRTVDSDGGSLSSDDDIFDEDLKVDFDDMYDSEFGGGSGGGDDEYY